VTEQVVEHAANHNLLRDVGISIMSAAILALPAYLLRLPLILAYLAAGVILGPLVLKVIQSTESIQTLSEIGLVLLMFILGLEIDIRKLLKAGKAVTVNGVTQFLGCAVLAIGFFYAFGFRVGEGRFDLVYLAVACSLSSTLIVVKILSDRMELDTLTSQITLGVLVLQDLWAIGFLAVQPNLTSLEAKLIAASAGRALILVVAASIAARFVLPQIFKRASRQPELLLVTAMAWCFAMCGLANYLSLSLEMGALIAGVSIASFPYHADVASKVSSLRDFFITLFFVALGLKIPYPTREILTLSGLVIVFLLISRVLTVFPVLYLMKYGNRASLVPALNLSQLSEFALVVTALGVSKNHVGPELLSAFIIALVATALISSALLPNAHRIYQFANPLLERIGFKDAISDKQETSHGEHAQIVLLGFYREGSSLLQEILSRHSDAVKKRLLVVDFNPEAHKKLTDMGVPCKYADLSHTDTLRHLELQHAKVLICTVPDHLFKGITNLKLLRALKEMAPEAQVVVTAETIASAREMYKEGADYVFVPRLLASQYLADLIDHIHAGTDVNFKSESKRRLENWNEVLA
jgi:Kef-type K+ transport system membrane component KefB